MSRLRSSPLGGRGLAPAMEEIWKDRASFDAWCAEFVEDCKEEADDDGNNSAYEKESDSGLVPTGREVAATDRGDSRPSRWPRLLLAVAVALLAGAVLAAALGPICAQEVRPAGSASSITAGDVAVEEQSVPSSSRLRGAAEAAVGPAGVRTPPARSSRVAAAPEGARSAAALEEEDISDSAKTLEQTDARVEELESSPNNILSNATVEGSWDKEPTAMHSASHDSDVTVAANVYD